MVTVNEHLPEDHRDHVTDFGDIRDEEFMPPGNSTAARPPTNDELAEANAAVEAERGTAPDSDMEEEDLIVKHHQGSSSWWSDPEAKSSDVTQANQPGYEDNPSVGQVDTGTTVDTSTTTDTLVAESPEDTVPEDNTEDYDPSDYTVSDVEAYASAHPDQIGDILQAEREGQNRSTLVSKLETMKVS